MSQSYYMGGKEEIDRDVMLRQEHQLQAAAKTVARVVGVEDVLAARPAMEPDFAEQLRASALFAPVLEVHDVNGIWAGQANTDSAL